MKSRRSKRFVQEKVLTGPGIAVLSVSFLLGACLGCFFGAKSSTGSGALAVARDWLGAIDLFAAKSWWLGFLVSFVHAFSFVVLALMLSSSPMVMVSMPLLVFVRGAVFSLAVSASVYAEGAAGLWSAVAANGVSTFFSLPLLLLVGTIAFAARGNTKLLANHLQKSRQTLAALFLLFLASALAQGILASLVLPLL